MTLASAFPHSTPRSSARRIAAGRAALLAFALGTAWLAGSPAAWAQQDMRALQNRLDRLERDISTLNLQLQRGGAAGGGAVSAAGVLDTTAFGALDSRVGAIEDDNRATTGAIEELGHRIRQLSERLDKLVGDVDFRLTALERGGSAAAVGQAPQPGSAQAQPPSGTAAQAAPSSGPRMGATTEPSTSGVLSEKDLQAASRGAPARPQGQAGGQTVPGQQQALAKPALPAGSPKEQYDHAFALMRRASYDQAEAAWREFLSKNPSDPLAPNARYWLGETFYVRGSYAESAQVFLEGYQAAPKGAKAPDALLKLGMSLSNLDKKREACATFDKLVREFPEAAPSLKSTLDRERQKSACK